MKDIFAPLSEYPEVLLPPANGGLSAIDRNNIARAHAQTAFGDSTEVLVTEAEKLFPGQGARVARRYFEKTFEMQPFEQLTPGAVVPLRALVAGGIPRGKLLMGLQLAVLKRLR